ncbi:MAG: LEA type 2 family protein [Cyclobacteriaceae bacterium]|nr:LEA type 2 family protein [Cyclobacteriaceae bacterium]
MKILRIVFLLAIIAGGCVPKEQVVLRAVNIKEVKTGADGNPLLFADVVFYNPNSTRMRLKRIDLDVMVDGKKAARVDQHLSQLIKGKSEFTIPLEVQLSMKDIGLLDTILNLFGGKKYAVQFEGSMKVTVRGFPVKVPVKYSDELKF